MIISQKEKVIKLQTQTQFIKNTEELPQLAKKIVTQRRPELARLVVRSLHLLIGRPSPYLLRRIQRLRGNLEGGV